MRAIADTCPNTAQLEAGSLDHVVNRRVLISLAILAIVLRLGVIVALRSWEHPGAMEHRSIARLLLAGEGFSYIQFGYHGPSSVQSPTYPLLLASLFYLFGIDSSPAYAVAMCINALVGGATVLSTYSLCRVLRLGRTAGWVAAAACAVWPTQVYAAAHVQAVSLITLGTVAMMVLFQKAIDSRRLGPWVGFSVVGCLSALTEPILLPPMALAGVLILFWRGIPIRIRLRNAAVLFTAAVLLIGPWAVRNRFVHGQWIPIKSTFWVNVWKGNNPYATGTDRLAITDAQLRQLNSAALLESEEMTRRKDFDGVRQYEMLSAEQLAHLYGQPDAAREKVFKEWAASWILSHPTDYGRLCLVRFLKTIWVEWDNPKARNLVYVSSRSSLLILSGIGLVLALRGRRPLLFPLCLCGLALLLVSATITAARFSIPFEPFQFALMASAIPGSGGHPAPRR